MVLRRGGAWDQLHLVNFTFPHFGGLALGCIEADFNDAGFVGPFKCVLQVRRSFNIFQLQTVIEMRPARPPPSSLIRFPHRPSIFGLFGVRLQ